MESSKSTPEFALRSRDKCESSRFFPSDGRRIMKQRAVATARQRSSRLYKSFSGSTCKRRNDKCSGKVNAQSAKIPLVQKPGYTIYRSASSVEMRINVDKFFDSPKEPVVSVRNEKKFNKDEKITKEVYYKLVSDSLEKEEQLQKQIVDLSIELKQRTNFYENKLKEGVEELKEIKKKLQKSFDADKHNISEMHEKELQMVYNKHQEETKELKYQYAGKISELQHSIEAYKKTNKDIISQMAVEAAEQRERLEHMMKKDHAEEINSLLKSAEEEKEKVIANAKKQTTLKYMSEMSSMTEQYEAQINELKERNLMVDSFSSKLTEAEYKITELEDNIVDLKEQCTTSNREKRKIEARLLAVARELEELQENFDKKLRDIEDKFVDKFNDIKLENTQLRGRILKLSQDISKYQSHLTKINYKGKAYVSQHERMQAVLRACNSANLSLIKVASDVVSTEIRKCSTPETKGEKMQALAIKRDEL